MAEIPLTKFQKKALIEKDMENIEEWVALLNTIDSRYASERTEEAVKAAGDLLYELYHSLDLDKSNLK